jgi:hypothetical protein
MTAPEPMRFTDAQLRGIKNMDDARALIESAGGTVIDITEAFKDVSTVYIPDSQASVPEKIAGDVAAYMSEFVRFTSQAHIIACVLWVMHTHTIDAAFVTPRLRFDGETGSGKSHALSVLEPIIHNSAGVTVYDTAPEMYRYIESTDGIPTFLIDEIEMRITGGRPDPEARALIQVINAGYKRGATVRRVDGTFNIFAPLAYAGIGSLHVDTLSSRTIPIYLEKKDPTDDIDMTFDTLGAAHDLRDRLSKWAQSALDIVRASKPDMSMFPRAFGNRHREIWKPLIAIADSISDEWGKVARETALEIHGIDADVTEEVGESIDATPAQRFDAAISRALDRQFISYSSYTNRKRRAWVSLWDSGDGKLELRMLKSDWHRFYNLVMSANPGSQFPEPTQVLKLYRDAKPSRMRTKGKNLAATLSVWHGESQTNCVAIDVTDMFKGKGK